MKPKRVRIRKIVQDPETRLLSSIGTPFPSREEPFRKTRCLIK
jgi:hypothetical protein